MRKRSINLLFDNVMWYVIYLFPLLFLLLGVTLNADGMTFLTDFLEWFNVAFSNNFIFDCLNDLFGAKGILPFFVGNWSFVITYMTYFICTMVIHLAVDFIVFIPRLAHKYMSCLTKSED